MSIRTKSQVKLIQIDLETGYQTEKVKLPGSYDLPLTVFCQSLPE